MKVMDEGGKFAAHQKKLRTLCAENNLDYTLLTNQYPIVLVISPLGGLDAQMSMLEEMDEGNVTSPDASIVFSVLNGDLTYRTSKTFTISDELFNKIKNLFKKLHYLWLQYFFRRSVEAHIPMPELPAIDEGHQKYIEVNL